MSFQKFFSSAPNQTYTDEYLNKLWEKHKVIYDPACCHGVRIIPRKGSNPLFEILGEDDGNLFSYDRSVYFDACWAQGLADTLIQAIDYWKNEMSKEQIVASHTCNDCVNSDICKYFDEYANSDSNDDDERNCSRFERQE